MNEDEIRKLTEEEVSKIERVNSSTAAKTEAEAATIEAEAAKESAQARRILFQRAARDALPFLVYVLTMGAVSIFGVIRVLAFDGTKLWVGAGLLAIISLAPILILPRRSLWWLKEEVKLGKPGQRF